jgi:glycosyltransferase involved in cell wall biosynthesis
VPNGVDVDRFAYSEHHRDLLRSELGLEMGVVVVGMIGRLADVKNHEFMLEVMALDARRNGSTVLLVIGDGPLMCELEAQVAQLGIGDRVRFLGPRTDVDRLMSALDWMVMPSHLEGLPLALVEAQSAGLPALVSEHVTREADLGLDLITWLPIDSPDVWQQRLAETTERPPPDAVRRRIRDAGYDIQSTAQLLLSLYVEQPAKP